ncbi:hypothetical protein [Candidatus Magnetominusculus xianensis]|uniref:Serum amyloid A protein n=1 Tax=Candidatus Magnetominusculus xianensis TaxID=1748249 RepID=A0ABR5SFU4_9BACT|nr:hypothetical protein [Candidatus Magnetominusculus xianensis]KWT86920.1 putative serum amyloid A protein [Candidatus Magnetominusculus xianensis]MBF0403955.1 hypothetical protein [Nitrospirota bacterium]
MKQSQQFWIQGEDGKLEGSLPDVPKKGGAHEAVKTSKQLNPNLAKIRENLKKHKNSVALASDKNTAVVAQALKGEGGKMPGSTSGVSKKGNEGDAAKKNVQGSSFLETLRKRIELKRQNSLSLKAKEIVEKAYAIAKKEKEKMDVAYNRLKNTPYGNIGVDKYYHSVAHCKIARLGYSGVISSHAFGLGKELFDVYKEHFTNPKPFSTLSKVKDSVEDMEANEIGRQAGIGGDPSKSCEELCKGQWPKSIPEEYKV